MLTEFEHQKFRKSFKDALISGICPKRD